MQFTSVLDDHYQGQATAFEIGEAQAALKTNVKDYTSLYQSPSTIPQGPVWNNPLYQDAMRNVDVVARAQGLPLDSEQVKVMKQEVADQMPFWCPGIACRAARSAVAADGAGLLQAEPRRHLLQPARQD
jgi:hypothetical protein